MKTQRSKVKKVKAYAVISEVLENQITDFNRVGVGITEKSLIVNTLDVFRNRREAQKRFSWIAEKKFYKIVPCTITYELPVKPKKR